MTHRRCVECRGTFTEDNFYREKSKRAGPQARKSSCKVCYGKWQRARATARWKELAAKAREDKLKVGANMLIREAAKANHSGWMMG